MTEWIVDLRPRVDRAGLSRVQQLLPALGPEDRLTLVFEREDAHQTGPVVRLLEKWGLGWQPRGGHGELYFLHAGRHLPRA
ncbi:MAG TPA: hypothetical protein VIL11_00110 [Limnochordales bacterium]